MPINILREIFHFIPLIYQINHIIMFDADFIVNKRVPSYRTGCDYEYKILLQFWNNEMLLLKSKIS